MAELQFLGSRRDCGCGKGMGTSGCTGLGVGGGVSVCVRWEGGSDGKRKK